jgi:hypothetical protein
MVVPLFQDGGWNRPRDIGEIKCAMTDPPPADSPKIVTLFGSPPTDLSGTQLMANFVLFDGAGFFLRSKGELLPITWGQLGIVTRRRGLGAAIATASS